MAPTKSYVARIKTSKGWIQIQFTASSWHNARDWVRKQYGEGNYFDIREV